ncbi:hypothetical protein [Streptomyces neyagawaensis]|uniref:hypothetical protein n=1 Tax=Streptomyces neyagawaensis TaxID=42238 RepID=UPI0006E2E236|nr:hypothetical protein [Streptomyces neyagawaensis]MCL6734398.1 hypothetical protein [Streptomyces neyagawaensis]MDE1682027.1 hypothetical protein [Streptomyces neyagawaensis]
MSDETTVDKADEGTGGEAEGSSRIAGGCAVVILAGLGVLVLKAVVTAAPYIAYFVVGILCTIGWQKARARLGRHRNSEGEEEAPAPDVGEALRRLIGDDKGVLLTTLRDDLKLPDTKAVKALLDEAGIPWKAGRTREGNGPSVRREHIPAAPSPAAETHGDGCCCRSGDNSNSDNAEDGTPEEGLHVEAIGNGGTVMYRHRRRSSRRHH